ncbi:unnamed protein product [Pylaiella littoralis]
MDAATETLTLRRQLEKAVLSEDVERMCDVLKSLGSVDVTLAVLQESKVGSTVSKLKKHSNEGVSDSAKALVKKWKRVVESSGAQGGGAAASPAGKSERSKYAPVSAGKGPGLSVKEARSSSGSGGASAGAGKVLRTFDIAGGFSPCGAIWHLDHTTFDTTALFSRAPAMASPAAPLSRQSSTSSSTSELFASVEVDGVLEEDGLPPSRLRMRKKLLDTLLLGSPEDQRLPTAHVAKNVECAMDAKSPYFYKKEDYLGKARQLVFNLKKNDQLRQDVREGAVAPERLVVMTSTELMSKDKKEEMDKASNERTEARMLDWYDKNQDKINKQCGIKETEGMFECGRCKSTKTTYTQKQTRSADEPMTTFVTCSNCKNRWKFC